VEKARRKKTKPQTPIAGSRKGTEEEGKIKEAAAAEGGGRGRGVSIIYLK
jgi:hypothetical protein